MKSRLLTVFLIFCCAQIFWGGEVWGQACTVNIVGNGAPSSTIGNNSVVCITGTRTTSLDLGNLNNVTVRVNGNFSSGTITYTSTNRISIELATGNFSGAISLNNSLSTFSVLSGRTYSGTLTVTNGTVTNSGTISNSVTLSNSSTYSNAGTSSGIVTLNGSSTYTNTNTSTGQTGALNINGTSQYISSGRTAGAVTLDGSNARYTLNSGGTHSSNAVTVTNGNLVNNAGATISSVVTLSNSSTYSNAGTQSGQLTIDNSSAYINSSLTSNNVTLNGTGSQYTITSSGTQNGGVISVNNGAFTNQGTNSRSTTLSNSSTYSNSGTSSGAVTLNGSSIYTNSNTATGQTGTVAINSTSQYISSGRTIGALTLDGSNARYTLNSGGTQATGAVTVTNGSLTNNTGATISSAVTLSNSSTYSNAGTSSGVVTLNGSSTYINSNTTTGQAGAVNINGTALYTSSGRTTGAVTANGSNARYTLNLGGTQATGAITVTNGSLTNNTGATISSAVTLSNSSSFSNSGNHTGNITMNNSSIVSNSGIITSSNIAINSVNNLFTNTPTGILNHTNSGSYTWRGLLNLEGQTTLAGNLELNGNGTVLSVLNSGSLDAGPIRVIVNAQINTSNPSNLTPPATINASSLTIIDAGGPGFLNSGINTVINVANQTLINGTAASTININGKFNTKTLNSGGSGGTVNVLPNGSLTVTNVTTINSGFTLNISGEFLGNTLGGGGSTNGLNVINSGKFTTLGDVSISGFPFVARDNAQIIIGGKLDVLGGASKLYISDDVNFSVTSNTTIGNLIQINDNAVVTFNGNVDISNSGEASLELNGSADVIIQSNLSKSYYSGTVRVNNSSQLVICNARTPTGDIDGEFPTDEASDQIFVAPSPAYYGGCRILPVEFIAFGVDFKADQRISKMLWSTAKEWENSHFEIERAVNSVKTWETIGRVEGHGYSDAPVDYNFTDIDLPKSGGNIFYRLKQVDYSGKYSYSNTRAIHLPILESEQRWIAYPNPTNGYNIQLASPDNAIFTEETTIRVSLSTSLGQQERIPGTTLGEINQNLSSSLAQKPAGVYLILVELGNSVQALRVIKI